MTEVAAGQGQLPHSHRCYQGTPDCAATDQSAVRALRVDELAYLKYSPEHYIRVKNNCIAEALIGIETSAAPKGPG